MRIIPLKKEALDVGQEPLDCDPLESQSKYSPILKVINKKTVDNFLIKL